MKISKLNRTVSLAFISFSFFLFSCKKNHTGYLTIVQQQYITTAHTGDTLIWQSNLGYKDTAVIQPIVYSYPLDQNAQMDNDAPVYSHEEAYYKYRFVDTPKTNIGIGLFVSAAQQFQSLPPFMGMSCITNSGTDLSPKDVLPHRVIGGVSYENVFWGIDPLLGDTIFWNSQGILGTSSSTQTVFRVK